MSDVEWTDSCPWQSYTDARFYPYLRVLGWPMCENPTRWTVEIKVRSITATITGRRTLAGAKRAAEKLAAALMRVEL